MKPARSPRLLLPEVAAFVDELLASLTLEVVRCWDGIRFRVVEPSPLPPKPPEGA